MPESTFKPGQEFHKDSHYFDDLQLGQRFAIPSRTMTDALFAAFQLASGDNHPIHYDVEYCRERGHTNRCRGRRVSTPDRRLPGRFYRPVIALSSAGLCGRYGLPITRNHRLEAAADDRRSDREKHGSQSARRARHGGGTEVFDPPATPDEVSQIGPPAQPIGL